MEPVTVDGAFRSQAGVISRRQVLAAGLDDNDVERLLRRREWAVVHPGVYVNHTGPLVWIQRAWAAVLALAPAVLAGPSALRVHGMTDAGGPSAERQARDLLVHVAVERDRHVKAPRGVVVVRRTNLASRAQSHLSPPRLRFEEAVIDVADQAARDSDAVGVISAACQQGLTTPSRLLAATRQRSRLKRRRLLLEVLGDAAVGVRSVLERRYFREVERPHGLPRGRRQRRLLTRRGSTYRDVEYSEQSAVVELDGRLVHGTADARWLDLERDIESAVAGDVTVRLGWVHVTDPCRTAAAVVRLLRSRGWTGAATACSPRCAVGDLVSAVGECGGSSAPGAGDPPQSAGQFGRGQATGGVRCSQPRRIADSRWSSG